MIDNQNRLGSATKPPAISAGRRWFSAPTFVNETDTRNAYLLNFITLAYLMVGVLVIVLALLATNVNNFAQSATQALVQGGPLIAILVTVQFLLRSGRVRLAALTFGGLLLLNQIYTLYTTGGTTSYSIFNYILVVMVFGLVLGRRYAIISAVIAAISSLIFFILGNFKLLPPITANNDPAAVGLFTFLFTVFLTTALLYLYLEQLDNAFLRLREANLVLEEAKVTLESRVAERTRNLELATEVGRSVSQVGALDVILTNAVEIIRSRFDLYYAQVYLTNANQTELVLEAGTGTVGQQLLARGHRLPLSSTSLNGRAALERHAVIVANTAASASFRPNPLLPDTRSEMAIPLIAGDAVVGVLDMQSTQAGALNAEVLPAFEALAGQLAIAIQNARLLAEAETSRAEVEKQVRRLARANWDDYQDGINQPHYTGFVFSENQVAPLAEAGEAETRPALSTPIAITGEPLGELRVELEEGQSRPYSADLLNLVARQVAQQIENVRLLDTADRYRLEAEQALRRLTREGWQSFVGEKSEAGLSYYYNLREVKPFAQDTSTLPDEPVTTLPLKIRDELVGQVAVLGLPAEDQAALNLVNSVTNRLSAHLEALRLAEETEKALAATETQSKHLAALTELGQNLVQADTLAEVFNITARKLPEILPSDYASLGVLNDEAQEFEILSLQGERGAVATGRTLPMAGTAVGATLEENRLKVWPNLANAGEADLRVLAESGLRAAMCAPLSDGERSVGALLIARRTAAGYSPQYEDLLNQTASLINAVLNNNRLSEETRNRARDLATVSELASLATSERDPQAMLQHVVDKAKASFGFYHAHIYLMNDAGDELVLTAGAGEAGKQMLAQGWRILMSAKQSLVAQAARTQTGVIANDVTQAPDFAPNPYLPNTRSELAVPIVLEGKVLGVLDVQSDKPDRFTPEDVNIQSTLASQLGIALVNARQDQETQQLLVKMNTLTRQLTQEAWAGYSEQAQAFEYDLTQVRSIVTDKAPAETDLAWQLKVQDEVIGQLEISDTDMPAEETDELVAAVAERLSVHLETLRLTEETQAALARNRELFEQEQFAKRESEIRARREQVLREITTRLASASDVASVLQVAAQEVGRALNRPTYVVLDPDGPAPRVN